ncbi:MAG: hypothetical protein LBO76_06950, partial [Treponema sp.]|nr:hypothetical protein [Treponema sp.]
MVRDQNPLAGKRRGRTPRSGGLLTLASVLFIAPFLSGCPHWLLPPLRVLDCSLEDGGVRVLFSAAPTEISV